MSLQTRITALVQAIGADIKALYSGKVGTSDSRLTDAREWTASTVTQAEAEAGTATTRRAWTAQRVFQAIAAWWAASAMKTKLDGIATGATANATDAQLRDRATHTGTQAISTVSGLQTALDGKLATSARGVANGVASLDANGLIPPMQLPSYVDDVLEYAATSNFPATGETGKIYIAINGASAADPTKQYRWTGTAYSEITSSPGSTDAVPEGSGNLYFTAARVRSTVLTGLSLASSAAVAATDTVLTAFGKIQARLNLLGTAANANVQISKTDTTAGALMSVGGFGLGATALSDILETAENWVGQRIKGWDSTAVGGPATAATSLGFDLGYAINRRFQLAITAQNTLKFRYTTDPTIAGSWREVYHDGNLVKQTSPTDTTAGALMAVGAFGLGSRVQTGAVDFNELPTLYPYTGFIPLLTNNLSTNGPGSNNYYYVQQMAWGGSTNCCQIAYPYRMDTEGFWMRTLFNGTWSPWRKIWHDGNFNPATKQDKSALVATATSRTLALTDAWNYVRPGTTSAITLTVPTNASVAFEIGTEITVRAMGNVTLAAASGVTLNAPSGGTLSMTARMTVTLKKVAADVWDVIGQTVAA